MRHSHKRINKAFSLIELSIVIIVVGILIAGVIQGKSLINKAQLKTAQSLTTNSPVPIIDDLLLWYETSLPSSFGGQEMYSGTKIYTWHDINPRVAQGLDATSAYYATITPFVDSPPAYEENVFGGIPAVSFDGQSALTYEMKKMLGKSFTIFLVNKPNDTSSLDYIIGSTYHGHYHSVVFFYQNTNVTTGIQYHQVGAASPHVEDVAYINTLEFDIDSGFTYWSNGDEKASNTQTTPLINSQSFEVYGKIGGRLAHHPATGANEYDGYIGEYIIYTRALKDKERQDIEDYLAQKYSIRLER